MKRIIAYYLLLFYIVAACKPFLPLVGDVLAHTFWQDHHAATVHRDQGDRHLHDQLQESASDQNNGDSPAASRYSESVSAHFAPHPQLAFIHSSPALVYRQYYKTDLPNPVIEKSVPPPRA